MKKTAVLLAGLLLVTGTVFAESKLDISGTIGMDYDVIDTTSEEMFEDASEDKTDLAITATYTVDENTSVAFTLDSDDTEDDYSDYEDTIDMVIKQTRGDFEVSFDLMIDLASAASTTASDAGTEGINIKEDSDSTATYIKWNMPSGSSLTAYPMNMGMSVDASLLSDDDGQYLEMPGVVYAADGFYVGAGIDSAMEGTDYVMAMAVKAGFSTEMDGMSLAVDYSGNLMSEDVTSYDTDTGRASGSIAHAVMATVGMEIEGITLDLEAGLTTLRSEITLGGDKVGSGIGLAGTATMEMTEVMEAYLEAAYMTDGFYIDETTYDYGVARTETGGVLETSVGVNYTLAEGLVLTPELDFNVYGEDITTDSDGKATNSLMRVELTLAYSL